MRSVRDFANTTFYTSEPRMKRIVPITVLVLALAPFLTGCGGDSGSTKQPKMTSEPKPGGVGPAALPASPGAGGGKVGGGGKAGGGANPGAAVD